MDWLPDRLLEAFDWAWVPAMGAIGGVMAALSRKSVHGEPYWSWRNFAGICAAAIAAICAYPFIILIADSWHLGMGFVAGSLGVIGHLGPRVFDDLWTRIQDKFFSSTPK